MQDPPTQEERRDWDLFLVIQRQLAQKRPGLTKLAGFTEELAQERPRPSSPPPPWPPSGISREKKPQ